MIDIVSESLENRMQWILETAWEICVQRIASERITINKESSLQLHYAYILAQTGELACIRPGESFKIELETHHAGKNIDIWCALQDCEAAIELKCFRKASNRAVDIDMYDVLKDISRLESYSHVAFRRFICLTDNGYYRNGTHSGHAGSVSIGNGKKYPLGLPITPTWVGKWKDTSRDKAISLNNNLEFAWRGHGKWHYLFLEVLTGDEQHSTTPLRFASGERQAVDDREILIGGCDERGEDVLSDKRCCR